MTLRHITALVATVAVLAGSVLYLSLGVLKSRVFEDLTTVTISAPRSNGLHAGSAVLFRGVSIGSVDSVAYRGDTIEVRLSYESRYRLPSDSQLSIRNQSLIGESGVMVMPSAGSQAPPITDGSRLTATIVDVPASVPQLLGSARTIIDQVDPGLVNDLIDSLDQALAGTDRAVDTLAPASQMLAATLIYSQPALVTSLRNGISVLNRAQFVGPSLRPFRTQIIYAANVLRTLVPNIKPFGDYTRYGALIQEKWRDTLDRGGKFVTANAPPVGRLLETLVPAAQRTGSVLAGLDLATLVDRASAMLPGDSVRLQVAPAN